MKVLCEHPVLIFNPRLKYLVNKYRHVVLGDHEIDFGRKVFGSFPWKVFYQAKNRVTQDNVDTFNVVDDAGSLYPVFMYVPCGHCKICRDKWLTDWQTRCLCESVTHPYPPHFVTLTYAPENRPSTMDLCYLDFDLFMKRFRLYIDRYTGKKNTIRYVACSEYTPNNHYPHIHMLVWGIPFLHSNDAMVNDFQFLHDFIQDECWQLGYIKIEVARDMSGRYGFKYLHKDDNSDCWFCASRRPGIGRAFADAFKQQAQSVSDVTTFSVTCFGKLHKNLAIPGYFKRIWFPTLSLLLPQKIMLASKRFYESVLILKSVYPVLHQRLRLDELPIFQYLSDVAEKYDFLEIDWSDTNCSSYARKFLPVLSSLSVRGKFTTLDRRLTETVPILRDGWLVPGERLVNPESDFEPYLIPCTPRLIPGQGFEVLRAIVSAYITIDSDYKTLMSYNFDVDVIRRQLVISAAHSDVVAARMLTVESPVTVESRLNDIDINERWIDSHWRTPVLDNLYLDH